MEREKIVLTKDELEVFDFTAGGQGVTWGLRDEIYDFVDKIRTDQFSAGPSWDIVVKRRSDDKFFKWNCWDAGYHIGYMMESGDNYMEEVFQETITTTIYK